MLKTTTPLLLALAMPLTGCGGSDTSPDADYPAGVAPIDDDNPAAENAPDTGDQTPDTPPADNAPDDTPDTPDTRTAEGLNYTVPAGWTVGAPRQMRVLTLDAGAGVEVAVAKWPGDVGGFTPNETRWLGQAGYNPADAPAIEQARAGYATITVGGAESTWMPMLDGTGGSPMIALWVPRNAETWTFKITGDADALRDKQDALRAWAESLTFE